MNELESFELAELNNLNLVNDEKKEKFKVTNKQTANWVFRKIKYIESAIKEINDLADNDVNKIENWRKSKTENYNGLKQFFEMLIKEYVMNEKEKDSNFELSTPYGTAYVKSSGEKWIYDEEKLISWLEKNVKELVNITKTVKKAELKKYGAVIEGNVLDINSGEVIEGVKVEEGEKTVIIKLN